MAFQKQSLPSFASIISVVSIALYCAGFLRVELELNEQKRRINALENAAKTEPPSSNPNLIKAVTKNVHGESELQMTSCLLQIIVSSGKLAFIKVIATSRLQVD